VAVLAEAGADLVRNLLSEAIAAGKDFEAALRKFTGEGDDEDVQAAFASQAEQIRLQRERLTDRLQKLGEGRAEPERITRSFETSAQMLESGHIPEERTLEHLVSAFGMEAGECAFYEALAATAAVAADAQTEALARQIEREKQLAAKKLFSFIRSRSKIAFNMLTPNELDPAVETKAFDNRVV